MVAYLSINHLGYCMLGLFAVTASAAVPAVEMQAALSGVFLQIFNHGITAAALFYFVGLLEQRRGARGHGRFRRTDATHAAPLRLDERGDVFVARPARAKWVYRRISDLQRLLRARCLAIPRWR